MFDMPEAEYTIVGLRELLELNRKVVKQIFLMMDEPAIGDFIRDNADMLELE